MPLYKKRKKHKKVGRLFAQAKKKHYLCTRNLAEAVIEYRGVEQLVARQAHNLEVACSSPASATQKPVITTGFFIPRFSNANTLVKAKLWTCHRIALCQQKLTFGAVIA